MPTYTAAPIAQLRRMANAAARPLRPPRSTHPAAITVTSVTKSTARNRSWGMSQPSRITLGAIPESMKPPRSAPSVLPSFFHHLYDVRASVRISQFRAHM